MTTKVPFSKEAKTIPELIAQLQNRGMAVDDVRFAQDVLNKVNYYRLSGYWFKYQNKWLKKEPICDDLPEDQKDILNNKFVVDISFNNIVDIYKFDTKLRSLCLDALEKIEIAINSNICEYMCNSKGGYWFLNKENVLDIFKKQKDKTPKIIFAHDILMDDINEVLRRNERTICIKSFRNKYSDKYPPYWIISQLMTFGTISKLYAALPPEDKKQIARNLGLNVELMEKSLQTLAYVRNVCAHYARLWDNANSVPPVNIKFNRVEYNSKYNFTFHTERVNTTFFPIFYLITLFLINTYPQSKWCNLVANKIREYQEKTTNEEDNALISFSKMGFPENWERLPLFEEMLRNQ